MSISHTCFAAKKLRPIIIYPVIQEVDENSPSPNSSPITISSDETTSDSSCISNDIRKKNTSPLQDDSPPDYKDPFSDIIWEQNAQTAKSMTLTCLRIFQLMPEQISSSDFDVLIDLESERISNMPYRHDDIVDEIITSLTTKINALRALQNKAKHMKERITLGATIATFKEYREQAQEHSPLTNELCIAYQFLKQAADLGHTQSLTQLDVIKKLFFIHSFLHAFQPIELSSLEATVLEHIVAKNIAYITHNYTQTIATLIRLNQRSINFIIKSNDPSNFVTQKTHTRRKKIVATFQELFNV